MKTTKIPLAACVESSYQNRKELGDVSGLAPQHRGERADHPAHRGGRRRVLPAGRRAPAHGRHAKPRNRGGRRLRDGRLGRRADRADPQRREQPPQGADRGRARARHPDDALAGRAGVRRGGVGGHPRGQGRVLRARLEGRAGGRREPGLRRGGAHGRLRRRADQGRRGGGPLQEEPLGPTGRLPGGAREGRRRERQGGARGARHPGRREGRASTGPTTTAATASAATPGSWRR